MVAVVAQITSMDINLVVAAVAVVEENSVAVAVENSMAHTITTKQTTKHIHYAKSAKLISISFSCQLFIKF